MKSIVSKRRRLPFDEANERDFNELTKRIQFALSEIRSNEAIKATESSLAKLAKCSRGTLSNRSWPLDELKSIQASRRANRKGRAKYPPDVARLIERCKGLEEQLKNNRDELLRWKMECDDRDSRIRRLEHINGTLVKQKRQLEKQLKDNPHSHSGNVVSIRFKD